MLKLDRKMKKWICLLSFLNTLGFFSLVLIGCKAADPLIGSWYIPGKIDSMEFLSDGTSILVINEARIIANFKHLDKSRIRIDEAGSERQFGSLIIKYEIVNNELIIQEENGNSKRFQRRIESAKNARPEEVHKIINVVPIEATPNQIDDQHEGCLLHITGHLSGETDFQDPELKVSAKGIYFERRVEMFAWQESVKHGKRGRDQVWTYNYEKDWRAIFSNYDCDSRNFKSIEHKNPKAWIRSYSSSAKEIKLSNEAGDGGRIFGKNFFRQLPFTSIPVPEHVLDLLPASKRGLAKRDGDYLYFGNSPSNPEIGDMRISFQYIPLQAVSVLAEQSKTMLVEFTIPQITSIYRIEPGTVSAEDMLKHIEAELKAIK